MPVLFFLVGVAILYMLLLPFKESADLLLNAITVTNKDIPQQKSIFNGEEIKHIPSKDNLIPSSQIQYPTLGTEYGAIIIEKYNVESKLIFGDSLDDLRVGVGHFNGSVFPGEPGTTLIGGHNTAELAVLDDMSIGDNISIKTNYETYTYKITEKKIMKYDDKEAIKSLYQESENNQLILYTCYPISMIGLTDNRLFAYAEQVDGRMIDLNN